jgi:sugar phosphate permease
LAADYIHKEALGKGAALYGLGVVIGEVIAMGLFFNLTKNWNAFNSFGLVGAVGVFFAICFVLMVKEPQLRNETTQITLAS